MFELSVGYDLKGLQSVQMHNYLMQAQNVASIIDELKIPRPCIDAATIGYNVEWSQELRLEESLREYVAGWMLVRILRQLDPLGLGEAAAHAQPVFELSVGYDKKGLEAEP